VIPRTANGTDVAAPELVATCWTTAGTARPLDPSEVSPLTPFERIDAVAAGGWAGLGFAHEDLELMRSTTGFDQVAQYARGRGCVTSRSN
jgi:hypothetical protein